MQGGDGGVERDLKGRYYRQISLFSFCYAI